MFEQENRSCIAEATLSHQNQCWRPPQQDEIKVNMDAAISLETNRTGKGIVARNWKGEIIRAWAVVETKKGEACMEEALAIRTAMQMGKEAGWKKVEFQSDCKQLIDKITAADLKDSSMSTVLEDIWQMREVFEQCTFSFVYRTGNDLCHRLAKFAIKLVNDVKWEHDFPVWLKELALKDYRSEATFCN